MWKREKSDQNAKRSEDATRRVNREAWAALRMIRDAIEEVGPVGVLPSSERVLETHGPTLADEATVLIEGIQRLARAGENASADRA